LGFGGVIRLEEFFCTARRNPGARVRRGNLNDIAFGSAGPERSFFSEFTPACSRAKLHPAAAAAPIAFKANCKLDQAFRCCHQIQACINASVSQADAVIEKMTVTELMRPQG